MADFVKSFRGKTKPQSSNDTGLPQPYSPQDIADSYRDEQEAVGLMRGPTKIAAPAGTPVGTPAAPVAPPASASTPVARNPFSWLPEGYTPPATPPPPQPVATNATPPSLVSRVEGASPATGRTFAGPFGESIPDLPVPQRPATIPGRAAQPGSYGNMLPPGTPHAIMNSDLQLRTGPDGRTIQGSTDAITGEFVPSAPDTGRLERGSAGAQTYTRDNGKQYQRINGKLVRIR